MDLNELEQILKGSLISVDISTDDGDSGNRIFAIVTGIQEDHAVKNGFIILSEEVLRNF